jgi:hypothetical protein
MAKSPLVGAIGNFFWLFKGVFFFPLGSGMGMGEGAKALDNMLNNLGSELPHITADNKRVRAFGIVIMLFICIE